MKLLFISLLAAALIAAAIAFTGGGINYSAAATIADIEPVAPLPVNGKQAPVVVELFVQERAHRRILGAAALSLSSK